MAELSNLRTSAVQACPPTDGDPGAAVLLTATINPAAYSEMVRRKDPELRAADYRRSLRFWCGLPDPRIRSVVFCENSGSSLDALKEATAGSRRPVEFLSFEGNAKPAGVHYGYAELGIIDHALANSALMKGSSHFIKATGRLTFPAVSRLLDSLGWDFDAAVDHRRAYRGESGFPVKARTQIMLFRRAFYEASLARTRDEMVGDGAGRSYHANIEEFIAHKLAELQGRHRIVFRHRVECAPSGFSAYQDISYGALEHRVKQHVRGLLRVAWPRLWL